MPPLIRIIYVSTARKPLTASEIDDLLVEARRNNAPLDVTGLLLFKGGNFLQVLEGPKAALHPLIEKIKADPRHHRVITVADESIPGRHFPDWSMGFRNLDVDPADFPEGFNDLLNHDWRQLDLSRFPDKVQAFLSAFVR